MIRSLDMHRKRDMQNRIWYVEQQISKTDDRPLEIRSAGSRYLYCVLSKDKSVLFQIANHTIFIHK